MSGKIDTGGTEPTKGGGGGGGTTLVITAVGSVKIQEHHRDDVCLCANWNSCKTI